MTSTTGGPVVALSRRIGAPAGEVFRILADPGRHPDLDGSGMLRRGGSGVMLSGVGDVFVMRMHYERYGDYEMNNHVVEFEPGRRIGWEPRPGRGHPDASRPGAAWGHRWIFDLVPQGAGATVVTEIFDGSRLPEDKRAEVVDGRAWWQAQIASTLERLAELCAAR
ncbi:SRPBCC family protein [Streptomyces sp. NPDC003758]|uniref:SRPBCC family protein n=1 Tax=Streptomyces cynarae TaxID=2981134 RepID=A0ABY6ECJ4_9ACTN|nr:SRPBCC family protein [Streptomyces cynarae]UXY23927.1 SRPBCC family protein [Streptomyces cynarae]